MNDKNYAGILKANLSPYRGQWVAMAKGKIVSHGTDPGKVLADARKAAPRSTPLLAKVPGKRTMIL